MKQIKLPTHPAEVPDSIEVRDFEDDGKHYRVVMEIQQGLVHDHFVLTAQCYEMNADGTFHQAPNGYPSRSNSTNHTVHKDDIGDVLEMDDAWCRYPGEVTPEMLLTLPKSSGKPQSPGRKYGELVWDETANAGAGRAWVWKEGFADITARSKIEDMQKVLRTSNIRSGFAFNKGPKK